MGLYGLSIRTDRTDRKSDIRSVNRISLVGLGIFSRQESVGTVCRSKEIARIAKLVYLRGVVDLLQDFLAKLFRGRTALSSSAVRRRRTKTRNSSECLSPNWTLFSNAVTISHHCCYCLTLEKGSGRCKWNFKVHTSTSCFFQLMTFPA